MKTITELIYNRHLRLYNELNDIHIFVATTVPLLESAASEHEGEFILFNKDIPFAVPSKFGRSGVAKRNHTELSALLKRFAYRELYENLLVSSVSRFEVYLTDILRVFLVRAPKKLTIGIKGGESLKQISIQSITDASGFENLIAEIVNMRLQAVFYAEPKEYCSYFNAVSELGITEKQFAEYFEIKATRDLIVHNLLVVNNTYLVKAGTLARGKLGAKLKITKDYFKKSISTLKTLSSLIEKKTRAKYQREHDEIL